jgi:hypothetical protein
VAVHRRRGLRRPLKFRSAIVPNDFPALLFFEKSVAFDFDYENGNSQHF